MNFKHCALSLAALLLLPGCTANTPSGAESIQSSNNQVSVESSADSSSQKEADREAVRRVGTYLLETSVSNSSSGVKKAMNPVDPSSYKSTLAFPGFITYWCSLLMNHSSFECSSRILKFEHMVRGGNTDPYMFGCQLSVKVDRENDEIIVRGCQGQGADNFYAAMMMKVDYDFETNAIGDYFIFMGSFGDSYKIERGTCYAQEGDTFKTGNYPDEETSPLADPMINAFVSMIPTSVLIEGDEARIYIEEYIQAGEYYESIGGNDAGITIVD